MRLLRWLNSIALIGALALPSGAALAQVKWDLASANPPTNFQTINLDKFIEDGMVRPAVRASAIAEMTMRPSTAACPRAVRCIQP